ncbi:hypothetical protein Leryth_009689 [Lithospermum erythrorhizon]|nr:hypothetical protein Leryth_009689 [Lithospermum erythrorhizon]
MQRPKKRSILQRSHPRPVLSGQFTVITLGSPSFSDVRTSTSVIRLVPSIFGKSNGRGGQGRNRVTFSDQQVGSKEYNREWWMWNLEIAQLVFLVIHFDILAFYGRLCLVNGHDLMDTAVILLQALV